MSLIENQESQNVKKDSAWIVAARTDGFGARMCALLNALVISKLTGLRFKFAWCAPENAPFMRENMTNLNDNQVLIPYANLPLKEQLFSAEFIAQYGLNDSYIGNIEQFADYKLPTSLKEYKEALSPLAFGYYTSAVDLSLQDLEDSKYRALLKEWFDEVSFTPRVREVMDLAHKSVGKLDFIAVHIRSGDIVYSDDYSAIIVLRTALNVHLALEIIRKELHNNQNIVLFSDDLNATMVIKESLKEQKGGKIYSIDDFFNRESFLGYEATLFEIAFMSHSKMIINGGSSGFSKLAMWSGGIDNHKSPNDYFTQVEQMQILEHSITKNIGFHPAHIAFACVKLILFGRENNKDLAYLKHYAKIAQQSYPNNFYKTLYVYFCLLDKDYKEANNILESAYKSDCEGFFKRLIESNSHLIFASNLSLYVTIFDVENYPYLAYFAFRIGIFLSDCAQEYIVRTSGFNLILGFLQNYYNISLFMLKILESGNFREIAPYLKRLESQIVGAHLNELNALKQEVATLKYQVAAIGGGGQI